MQHAILKDLFLTLMVKIKIASYYVMTNELWIYVLNNFKRDKLIDINSIRPKLISLVIRIIVHMARRLTRTRVDRIRLTWLSSTQRRVIHESMIGSI